MGLEKLIKREIGITIAVVLLVTTTFIMFSYAIFKVEVSGEANAVTFGDINLSLCKDATCNTTVPNLGNIIGTKTENGATKYVPVYPQKDPTTQAEWDNLKPYTFILENKGTIDLYVTLHLIKQDSLELKYTIDDENQDLTHFTESVDDSEIKIAIGEQGTNPVPKLFSSFQEEIVVNDIKGRKIAYNISIPAGQSKTFNLYAWLTENAQNASQGKIFVTQITAKGEYNPDAITTE